MRMKYMYGEGFTCRKARYTLNGSASTGVSNRRDSTTWKMSPAAMWSFAVRTAASYASRLVFERTSRGPDAVTAGSDRLRSSSRSRKWMRARAKR